MALIEIHADLGRAASALERIAAVLENFLDLTLNPGLRMKILRGGERGPELKGDAISAPTDEELARAEEEEERLLDAYGEV